MTQRLNYPQQAPELFKKFAQFSTLLADSSLGKTLHDLGQIRASQLNGCGFCLDMHSKEAKIHGERELRLYHLPVWRESPLFDARERAALAWTEALTRLDGHPVSDALYEEARAQFDEKELTELTWVIATINAWNRLGVGFQAVPGSADKAFGLAKANLS